MKSTNEPAERDLTLGTPIRPEKPAEPDRIGTFNKGNYHRDGSLIGNHSKAVESIADTLRRKVEKDEQTCDCTDAYSRALLGCI